ncbi:hypothetical protein [Streptomyces sp. NPDC049915]|uniref:hypothetical protein n=1 Tax=Streptomyces sp. NPDC049915 TaxID=3155510 RepID=UPI0034383F58
MTWRRRKEPAPPYQAWTQLDEHLWHTCAILADWVADRLHLRPRIATPAPLSQGELPLAVGHSERMTWQAVGNGTYNHTSVFAFGSPAFVLGSLAGAAVGNASRRRAAQDAARPRWVHSGMGYLTVTTLGFHFSHPQAGMRVHYAGLDSIDLIAPDLCQVAFHDQFDNRPLLAQLRTPWASLLFVLAALSTFPSHPRLVSGGWLPPGFMIRCAQLGRPCPLPPSLLPPGP